MRLTLRTLLAYLDDILDPGDAEELSKKIEESEFASSLVHRIRGAMRRLRLGAPKLEGKGVGLDANTVAEYLDSTLSSDQVADFEKVCLESDVHLAEAASCHQVLTLVLGEPADVQPAVRERCYLIGAPQNQAEPAAQAAPPPPPPVTAEQPATEQPAAEPQPAAAAAVAAAEPAATPPAEPKSRRHREVPDYLRMKTRPRLWPAVATLVVAFGLTAVVLVALGWNPFRTGEPDDVAQTPGDQPAAPVQPTDQPDGVPPAEPGPETPEPAGPTGDDPTTPGPAEPAAPGPEEQPGIPPEPIVPGPEEPTEPAMPPEDDPAESDPTEPTPPGDQPTTIPAEPGAGLPPEEPGVTEPPPAEPIPAVDVGRFTSDDQMLLHFDKSQNWVRLEPRAPLKAGDHLLALPGSRPQLMFSNGVQMTLDGGTRVQLGAPDQDGAAHVVVEYGRALIIAIGAAGAQIEVQFGAQRGVATLGDASSEMAVETRFVRTAGSDPEQTAAQQVVEVVASSGRIGWEEPGQLAVALAVGQRRRFIDDAPGTTVDGGATPAWIDARPNDIERSAAQTLEKLLTSDRPASLSLKERADDRRSEVRSLAVQCLGHIDHFDAYVTALNDADQKAAWPVLFDQLQQAIGRSDETAGRVRQALEKVRTQEAAGLYRMLWGYSADDLNQGEATKLVSYLSHGELDYRVLAFENLRRIAGKTLNYRPELPETRRRTSEKRWQELLDAGQLTVRPPAAEPPAEPVDGPPDAP